MEAVKTYKELSELLEKKYDCLLEKVDESDNKPLLMLHLRLLTQRSIINDILDNVPRQTSLERTGRLESADRLLWEGEKIIVNDKFELNKIQKLAKVSAMMLMESEKKTPPFEYGLIENTFMHGCFLLLQSAIIVLQSLHFEESWYNTEIIKDDLLKMRNFVKDITDYYYMEVEDMPKKMLEDFHYLQGIQERLTFDNEDPIIKDIIDMFVDRMIELI